MCVRVRAYFAMSLSASVVWPIWVESKSNFPMGTVKYLSNASIRHMRCRSCPCFCSRCTWLRCEVDLPPRRPLMALTSDMSLRCAEKRQRQSSHFGNTELPLSPTPRDSFQSRPDDDDATPGEELHKFST